MLHFLSLFHISLNMFLSLYLRWFLLLSVPFPTPASTVSPSLPWVETLDPPASKPVQDFRYVYTHRLKVSAFEPVLANPSSVDGPPQLSASLSDLDISIALRKGKRFYTDHPILNFISYDHFNPTFCQFVLSLSSKSIPRSYTEALLIPAGSRLWIRRRKPLLLKELGSWFRHQ